MIEVPKMHNTKARYTVLLFLGLERINKYKMRSSTTTVFGHIVYGYPYKMFIEEVKHHYPDVWLRATCTDKEWKLMELLNGKV